MSDKKKPSVSTITGMLDKPALLWWSNKIYGLGCAEFVRNNFDAAICEQDILDAGSNALQKMKAPVRGTEIHGWQDKAIKNMDYGDIDTERYSFCHTLMSLLRSKNVDPNSLKTEKSFISEKYGYNGKCDIFSKDGIVIDAKSKDFTEDNVKEDKDGNLKFNSKKKIIYPDVAMGLVAYGKLIDENLSDNKEYKPITRFVNIFISRSNPELIVFHEWDEKTIQNAWIEFQMLLNLWWHKATKGEGYLHY